MKTRYLIPVVYTLLATAVAYAQQEGNDRQTSGADKPVPCTVEPVFHCVQTLGDGTLIAHYGYTYFCNDGSQPELETYLDIGDDNLFQPGARDRGQPKVFMPGKNVDSFEVELTAEEVQKGIPLTWNVLGRSAQVGYAITSDNNLNCAELPK